MVKHWLTFGMSAYETPGFQDTSRLMSHAFSGDVAYVEPPKPFVAWRKLAGTVFHWSRSQRDHCTVLTPPLPIPRKIDPSGLAFDRQVAGCNRELVQLWGAEWRASTVFYVTNWTPNQQRLIEALRPQQLVFDVVDDVLSFPYDWDRAAVIRCWQRLADTASVVLAVSPAAQSHVRRDLGVEAHLCPNGVNTTLFMKQSNHVPTELLPYKHARICGFAGTLNHWIDTGAIAHLARLFPDVQFILMGRVGHFAIEEQGAAFERLKQLPNVHYVGPIP